MKTMDIPTSVIIGSVSLVAAIASTVLASLGAISVVITLRGMSQSTHQQVDEYIMSSQVDNIIRNKIDAILVNHELREYRDDEPILPT